MTKGTWGLVLGTLIAFTAAFLVTPAIGTPGLPSSMAALGSGTSAGTCTDNSCTDQPQNSWSTGTNPAVTSTKLRVEELTRATGGVSPSIRAYTFATSRFNTVADLPLQARQVVTHNVRYVSIDLGVGDLCMGTALTAFRKELDRGLAAVAKNGPPPGAGARMMFIISIEDLSRHWQVVRQDPIGARALKSGRHLDCGLGSHVTTTRLAQIRRRTIALNRIIARVCFAHQNCLYDAGRHFRMPLRASYFSRADFRYLSVEGQRALAETEWKPARALMNAMS